ncbi:MAG: neutral/alkaline non-lysosomal ceramidase N-terminal domain-containing protein [Verrucomicrobiales bacterium]|nr:neutral/alkaline non-lysosomal ceramidase N-terminal domain-containing protein [Verrucomicrobiales bacterium]
MSRSLFLVIAWGLLSVSPSWALWEAGAARVDITPEAAVMLSGYASRTEPFEKVLQPLQASALALRWFEDPVQVLVTVDNCAVPASLRERVLDRLEKAGHKLEDTQLALHSSHTHCAPMLRDALPMMYGRRLTPEEQAGVDAYTALLEERLVQVVEQALAEMAPAKLAWEQGKVSFANNRRENKGGEIVLGSAPKGPTDHALPVLRVTDAGGRVKALYCSYACHCTTLALNAIHGDWAGSARQRLQAAYPEAVALVAIGCGGDQNPNPRRELEYVEAHGNSLAKEVQRVASGTMKELAGPIFTGAAVAELPFVPREAAEWEELTRSTNRYEAFRAEHFAALLKQGEPIPAALRYPVQAWAFGGGLLMLQLPGEVVVDYGLRFKKHYGPEVTWVNGYTNGVPCYIASQRLLGEGGYEVDSSMRYYGQPNRFADGVEERIARAVEDAIPASWREQRAKSK